MYSVILQMQNEVTEYAQKIEEICKIDKDVDNLYLGCQIYYTPLKDEPSNLMFVGINPGSGGFKERRDIKTLPLLKSEYETEEYNLQKEWKYVFGEKNINNLNLLYDSFKTNCCFFATENETNLRKLKSILKYKYRIDLLQKEKEWIPLLINHVYPKVIICEGFGSFNALKKIYSKEYLTGEWTNGTNTKIAYLSQHPNEFTPVIGFKRIYSTYYEIDNIPDTIRKALDGNL